MPQDHRKPLHTLPQCPVCGSTNLVHDELLTGEQSWRCRECGHEWPQESRHPEDDTPAAG